MSVGLKICIYLLILQRIIQRGINMSRKKKPLPLIEGVEITGLAAEGKAIAKVSANPLEPDRKIVVFVPYGAPGDVADIKLDRKKNSYAEGHIERLVRPSAMRQKPFCQHFGLCGGCKWQHIPYAEQLRQKHQQVVDALQRIAKVPLPEVSPTIGSVATTGYRNKMEYSFSCKRWRTWEELSSGIEFPQPDNGLGFHIPGAFDKVLHITNCHLQDNLGNEIRNFIYEYAQEHSLSFYDIRGNAGLLRSMMLRLTSTGDVMLCMQFGQEEISAGLKMLDAVGERFPQISSLLYAVNTKANDTLDGLEIVCCKGLPYVTEEMEGLHFRVGPKSFYQTNSGQAYELYKVARRFAGLEDFSAGEKPLVYDLYTGTGTIAQFVARGCRHVVGIEYVPEAIEDARLNARLNGIVNTTFVAGDMKNVLTDGFIAEHGRPDVIIVDPPRAGMHPDVVKVIMRAAPQRIVYVSCNPATQARDLALFDDLYAVAEVQPVDMFPHTHHVENVVCLQRRQ